MTAITFPNSQLAIRNLLRTLLADRAEPVAGGVTVSTKDIPGGDEGRPLPYIQVRTDGRARDSRLNGTATVRVLVYHRDEGLGEELAALCEALLLDSSSGDVRSIGSVAGPLSPPGGDPDTGDSFTFFTISARLRPRQLT